MAVKALLDQEGYDALSDALKPEYSKVEKDGKTTYVLDVLEVDTHPRVAGLKSAFEKNKREIDRLTDLAAKFENIDPDKARDALDRIAQLEAEGGDGSKGKQAELDALKQRLEATHTRAIENLNKKYADDIGLRDRTINKLTVTNELNAAIESAGFDPKYKRAVIAELMLKNPTVILENGEFRGVFKTDLGDLPIRDFVTDFAKSPEAEAYLPPSDKGGSGAPPKGGAGGAGGAGKTTFDGNDPLAWGKNADALAAGKGAPQGGPQ